MRSDVVRYLTVVGAVALSLLLGRVVAPADVEAFERLEYLLLVSVFPLLAVLPLLARATGHATAERVLTAAFAVAGTAAVVYFLVRVPHPAALPAALLQVGATWLLERRAGTTGALRTLPLEGLLAAGAWNAALGLESSRVIVPVTVEQLLASGRLVPWLALPVCLGLVVAVLRPRAASARRAARSAIIPALALVPMAVASLRVGYLFDYGTLYHWGFFVGPAELVRLGGSLLWDVPSQYGFLSTLTVAALPAASVWDGFFRLNGVLLALSALLLFLHVRAIGDRPWHLVVAFLVSMSAVFWLPGLLGLDGFSAPLTTPSGGPFRFVWWFVLMTVLRAAGERGRAGRPLRPLLVGGSMLWLAGCLWSSESAVYCTASWLPAYALMVWLDTRRAHRVAPALGLVAVPPLLAAAAVGGLATYYRLRLGHGPDWRAFVEYGTSFAGGHGALPVDPHGPVWVLLLAFVSVSAALVTAADRASLADLVPLVGAWSGLWAIASYFVARSAAMTVASLMPVVCTAVALVLQTHPRPRAPAIGCAALLVVVCTIGLASGRWTNGMSWSIGAQYGWSVDGRRPAMDEVDAAQLRPLHPDDAIVFCSQTLPPRLDGAELQAWLPTFPFALFDALPEARRRVYVRRFVARAQRGGWLAEPKAPSYRPASWQGWFPEELRRSHAARQVVEGDHWRFTWFDYVGTP